MGYLLDTNACVHLLRGNAPVVIQRLAEARPKAVHLCSPVLYELYYGAYHSAAQERNLATLEAFRATMINLPFNDNAAEVAGRVRATLATAGTPIGPIDLLIASLALVHDLTQVTHNTREFGRIPDLRLEDWEVPRSSLNGSA